MGRPRHDAGFRERFAALERDLLEIDAKLEAAAEQIAGAPLLFSHPVYQYLRARYDLNAVSVHWEPGKMPDDAQWRELARVRAEHSAAWMIWEEEPLAEITARLERAGVRSMVLDPCAGPPALGDLLDCLRAGADGLLRIPGAIRD